MLDLSEVLRWLQEMSGEVVDSNPYSRLMALKRMGIVNNYEDIRGFSVAIVVSTGSEIGCTLHWEVTMWKLFE